MLLAFVLWLGWAPSPSEAAPGVTLRWSAPPECPDEEAVRAQIDRALGGPPPVGARVDAEVVVERTTDALFSLELEIRSESHTGRRHLEGRECEALAEAAAVIVAVAIDPRVLERDLRHAPEEQESEPEAESASVVPLPTEGKAPEDRPPVTDRVEAPAPVPASSPPPSASGSQARGRPSGVHVGLLAMAGPGFAILPAPTAVVSVGASVTGRLWRAELGVSYWIPREERSSVNPNVGGSFQVWSVGARGCVEPAVAPVSFPICGGLEAGAMHGRGVGALDPNATMAPWVAAVGGIGLLYRPRIARERLGFLLRGEGLFALTRPRFETEPSGLVYRARVAGAQVLAGVEVRLR